VVPAPGPHGAGVGRLRVPALLALITALTAVSGYLREFALATTFGAGLHTDGYFVAAAIPMVIGDLLLGAALTASIVPVFAPLLGDPAARLRARRSIAACFWIVAVLSLCLAALLLAGMPALVRLLSPGFAPEASAFTVGLGRSLVWLLPLNALVLLSSLLLNASSRYLAAASAWLIINLAFFAIVELAYPALGAEVLVWAPIAGPLVVAVFLLVNLARGGLAPALAPEFGAPPVRQVLRLGAPLVATVGIGSGLGILMLSHLILRALGSALGEGSVSALGYAFRLYEVPVSLVVATAGTLAFTELSRRLADGDSAHAVERCRSLLAWGVIVLAPVVCLTILLADTVVRLLFERGAFSEQATRATADALRGFAPAIFFESILMIGLRVLYALRKPAWAVGIGAATVAAVALAAVSTAATGSLLALAGAVSIGFALAALALVAAIGRLLGARILPAARESLSAMALAAGLWLIADYARGLASPGLAFDIALAATYCAVYVVGIGWICPERRAEVSAVLSR